MHGTIFHQIPLKCRLVHEMHVIQNVTFSCKMFHFSENVTLFGILVKPNVTKMFNFLEKSFTFSQKCVKIYQKCCKISHFLAKMYHFLPFFGQNVGKMRVLYYVQAIFWLKWPVMWALCAQMWGLTGPLAAQRGLQATMWAVTVANTGPFTGYRPIWVATSGSQWPLRVYMYTTRVKSMRRSRVFCYWGLGI